MHSETDDSDNSVLDMPIRQERSFQKPQKSTSDKIAGVASVLITLLLVSSIYGSHLFLVFLPWIEQRASQDQYNNTWLWTLLGIMSAFVVLGLWSYFAAMFTQNRVTGSNIHSPRRICKKCHSEKPVRTHHCSVCQECILRMDHHCPWINNCVGLNNHGHYMRFLSYMVAAMLLGLLLMTFRLGSLKYWQLVRQRQHWTLDLTSEAVQMAVLIADVVGCAILTLLIGLLTAVQYANMILGGHTTIEGLEISQLERDCGQSIPFPFDRGSLANAKAVFGKRIWLWPFPLPLSLNPLDGVSPDGRLYETRPDALMNGVWPLPGKEPLLLQSKVSPTSPVHNRTRFRQGSADDGGGFIVPSPNYTTQ